MMAGNAEHGPSGVPGYSQGQVLVSCLLFLTGRPDRRVVVGGHPANVPTRMIAPVGPRLCGFPRPLRGPEVDLNLRATRVKRSGMSGMDSSMCRAWNPSRQGGPCWRRRRSKLAPRRSCATRRFQGEQRHTHRAGDGVHPSVVACEPDPLPVFGHIRARRQMQRVEGARRGAAGKGI